MGGKAARGKQVPGEACLLPVTVTVTAALPPGAPGPAGAAASLPGSGGAALSFAGRSGVRGDRSPPGGGSLGSGVHRPPRAEHRPQLLAVSPSPGPGGTLSHTFHAVSTPLGPGGGTLSLPVMVREAGSRCGHSPSPSPASGTRLGCWAPPPQRQTAPRLPSGVGAWRTLLWSAVPQGPLSPGRDHSSHTTTSSGSSLPTGNMRLPG